MEPQQSDLGSLEHRLRNIVTQSVDSDDAPIKSEEAEIYPSLPRYLCAECAFSTTNSGGLASHFRAKHTRFASYRCRWVGCSTRCVSQDAIDRHCRTSHGIPCPQSGCEQVFISTSELHHHLAALHATNNASTIFKCLFPGCGQGFPSHNVLLEHYDGLHPPYIYQEGKKAPYKCPFCHKRYIKDRYMTPHVRSHLANRWAPADQRNAQQDQHALIRQSRAAAAEKALQAPEEPPIKLEQAPEDNDPPADDEGEYSVHIIGCRLYIDDELILPSPTWGVSNASSGPHSPELEISTERIEMMAIGYVLGPHLTTTRMRITDDDEDEYPEAFALDDDELPTGSQRYYNTERLSDTDQGRRIFGWILHILGLGEWISVSEIGDLWTHVLEDEQRVQIMRQFHAINVTEDEDQILVILRSSLISELIHEWATFKLTAFQRRANGVSRACSAQVTMFSLLQYSITLEGLIDEGRLMAIPVPDLVRRPPQDRSNITSDTPINDLIEALTQRVKCRMVHERWVQFTNVLVLKEAQAYVLDLKTIVRVMYPFDLHGPEWYYSFRLDRDWDGVSRNV